MKTLTATLTTAQRAKHIQPSVTATLTSNGWPAFAAHAVRIAPTTRDGDAVSTGTAIVRVCNDGGTIRFMRITDPGTVGNWYQWQALVSGVGASTRVCIFRAVGRVVVAWLASNEVRWRYSDDDGATWSGSTDTAAYAGAITSTSVAIGGISSAVTQRGGVAIAYDQDGAPETYHLLLWRYNEVANTWVTTVGDYAGGDINEPDSVAGVYRADSDDYTVALLQVRDTGTVTGRPIKLLHATASAWVAADTQTHSALTFTVYDASNRAFIQLSQTKINGYYWLTFSQAYHDTGFVVYLARSDDGLFYSAYVATEIRALQFAHVRMIEHGDYIYLIKPAEVWRAENSGSEELADLTVVSYDLDGERMTVVLHDADGNLAGSSLLVEGGRLSVARGLVTMVGAERVTLHTFDVMSVEIVGAKLTVKAETALARMRRWVSEYTLTWTGTLRNLLERLAAWCDIHAVSVDGAAAWSNTISGFVVASGQRGDQVLARLQRYYPFVVEMNGGTLTASVAVAAPASTYDFALHRGVIGSWAGYRTAFNQIFVYGTGTDLAEAFAYTPGSPARPLRLADRFLTTLALVQARASAELIVQKEKRRVGELVALPHFGAERGDVVTADGENWRIVEIAEKYRKPHGMAQTLTLRGTT